jgi:hypothetical protein
MSSTSIFSLSFCWTIFIYLFSQEKLTASGRSDYLESPLVFSSSFSLPFNLANIPKNADSVFVIPPGTADRGALSVAGVNAAKAARVGSSKVQRFLSIFTTFDQGYCPQPDKAQTFCICF